MNDGWRGGQQDVWHLVGHRHVRIDHTGVSHFGNVVIVVHDPLRIACKGFHLSGERLTELLRANPRRWL